MFGLLTLVIIILFGIYWLVPFGSYDFKSRPVSSNFSLNNSGAEEMQFYPNMRFSDSRISYMISDCSLDKEEEMVDAFRVIENETMLNFYPVGNGGSISITCDEKNRLEKGLFIAGEGGPTNITQTDKFNVILNGKILLIRNSRCGFPNVAVHELLHVLGFDHSTNKNNIMYNFTECGQTIGDDIPELLNSLYSIESNPDLSFENVSARMHGRYLDASIEVRNNGLKQSDEAKIAIYGDDKIVEELELKALDIGTGVKIVINNTWVSKRNVEQLGFFIETDYAELDKMNNQVFLDLRE